MTRKHYGLLGIGLLTGFLMSPLVKVAADQGFYVIDSSARPGMLMSVSDTDPNVAVPATTDNAKSLVGVLGDEPTSFDIQDGQQNILTGGIRNTLVTTINGDIKKGDYITASSIVGLGGKLEGSGWVVGIAQGEFTDSSQGAVKLTVTDTNGTQHDVYVGSTPILIKVLYYDDRPAVKERDVSFIPEKLQKTIDTIAGRRASQVAVILASLVVLAGLFIGGLIAYTATRSGIVSTARQPLAKQAIIRKMLQSCLIAFAIVAASLAGAFVIVRIV